MSVRDNGSIPTSPKTPLTRIPFSSTQYSDPDVDPTHISEIAEDGMVALRLVEGDNMGRYTFLDPETIAAAPSSRATSAGLLPKQIIRVERDYSKGELCQFNLTFPDKINGRVSPHQFEFTISTLNGMLEKAHNPKYNWFDNLLSCLTLYASTLCIKSHYERTIEEICKFLDRENQSVYNPQGLSFRNPRRTAFLFVSF